MIHRGVFAIGFGLRLRYSGERRRRDIERKRRLLAAQIEELKLQAEGEAEELAKLTEQESDRERVQGDNRATMSRMRQADRPAGKGRNHE